MRRLQANVQTQTTNDANDNKCMNKQNRISLNKVFNQYEQTQTKPRVCTVSSFLSDSCVTNYHLSFEESAIRTSIEDDFILTDSPLKSRSRTKPRTCTTPFASAFQQTPSPLPHAPLTISRRLPSVEIKLKHAFLAVEKRA